MTLLPISTIPLYPLMPAKTLKIGPYREQAEAFIARRKKLKMSQTAVAEAYGGQQGYISDIERGWVNFAGTDIEWFERMGRALDLGAEQLMALLGVRYVIADPEKTSNNSTSSETATVIYASIEITVFISGPVGGELREMTVLIDKNLLSGHQISGMLIEHAHVSASALGMLAIYSEDIEAEPDDVIVVEYQGERHLAYALAGGSAATDTPINPRTPLEFMPDKVLGVVLQLQTPERPRRFRLLS